MAKSCLKKLKFPKALLLTFEQCPFLGTNHPKHLLCMRLLLPPPSRRPNFYHKINLKLSTIHEGLIRQLSAEIEFPHQISKGPHHFRPLTSWHVSLFLFQKWLNLCWIWPLHTVFKHNRSSPSNNHLPKCEGKCVISFGVKTNSHMNDATLCPETSSIHPSTTAVGPSPVFHPSDGRLHIAPCRPRVQRTRRARPHIMAQPRTERSCDPPASEVKLLLLLFNCRRTSPWQNRQITRIHISCRASKLYIWRATPLPPQTKVNSQRTNSERRKYLSARRRQSSSPIPNHAELCAWASCASVASERAFSNQSCRKNPVICFVSSLVKALNPLWCESLLLLNYRNESDALLQSTSGVTQLPSIQFFWVLWF